MGAVSEVGSFLDDAYEALAGLRDSATDDARLFGFAEAADFAGRVEDLSRCVEYVQIVAAQAVDRTRTEEQTRQPRPSGAQEWRTGWTEPAGTQAAAEAAASTDPART
ncbi:HNH endonuclease, partial [Paenarthrobacter sp. NPDC089316]